MASFIWQRRGRFAFVLLALTALWFVVIGTRSTGPALATSDVNPYVAPDATDTNTDPTIFETTIKAEAHTITDIGTGISANVLTYNGTIPGPTIRVKVGDTLIVHFENNIAHNTAIHWHGIELANSNDGTPITQNQVVPGGKYLYKFKVPRPGIYWYHPHHHSSTNQVFKGLYGVIIVTDPNDTALVDAGVLPPPAQTKVLALSDISVCAQDGTNPPSTKDICETNKLDEDGNTRVTPYNAGDVPNIQKGGTSGTVKEGVVILTNGKNVGGRAGSPDNPGDLNPGASTLNVMAGQGWRFQMGSEATVRFFRLRLTGRDTDGNPMQIPLVRVGGEGGLLNKAVVEGGTVSGFNWHYDSGEILIDPGDRADVVAVFPLNAAGVFTLWEKDFGRTGPTGNNAGIPEEPVAHFNITGTTGLFSIADGTPLLSSLGPSAEVEDLRFLPVGGLLDPSSFSPSKIGLTGPEIPDIRLTNVSGGPLSINKVTGEHDYPLIPYYVDIPHQGSTRFAKLGDVLQLTVTNSTGAHHPFHLHGFSMQPISLTDTMTGAPPDGGSDASPGDGPGYTYPYREFRDNIDIPGGYTLTFRIKLTDRAQMDGTTMGGGTGRWVFHCHIFFHASFGMISEFVVTGADGNERPYVNADQVSVSGNSGDTLTMTGTYKDPDGDTPITLTPSIGTLTQTSTTWSWTGSAASSQFVYVTASDPDGLTSQAAFELDINQPPVLTVPGPQSQDYHDDLTFGISATDPDGDTITLGASGLPSGLAFVDNGNGTGTVSGTLTATPGVYTATFSASDGHNPAVTKTVQITVTREETTLTYTGPTVILNAGNVTLSAVLKEDGVVPIAGRTVGLSLGAQSCTGTTLASGVASCIILVNAPLGTSIPITATFAGDTFYLPSTASATAVVFAFPTRGVFVVGNVSAAGGGTQTWWGSSWSNVNFLTGGLAPSSFKGFAGTVTLPTSTPPAACGSPWSTSGGSSPPPTLVVPSYMGVVVASTATKSGTIISGNTVKIVVVQINPGYAPNGGGDGTGTIVGTFCQ